MAFRFGPFTVDEQQRQLSRGDNAVHLSRKAFDLLMLLVRERPAAVSKADIHQRLWPETFVSDGNLAVHVAEIRDALGDDSRHPRFIRTVHRVGYAFSAAAVEVAAPAVSARYATPYWLMWGTQRAQLLAGENVVGRDPAADVRIDAVGVSRRHALIVVGDDTVTLHDLASKNGTFVNDVRVTLPIPLVDGTEVRLGPISIRIECARDTGATQTWTLSKA